MADTLASAYNPAAGRRCDPIPEPDFPWVPVTILPDMSSFETANLPLLGPLNQFSQTALDSRTEKNGFMKWNGASRSATGWNGLWRVRDYMCFPTSKSWEVLGKLIFESDIFPGI